MKESKVPFSREVVALSFLIISYGYEKEDYDVNRGFGRKNIQGNGQIRLENGIIVILLNCNIIVILLFVTSPPFLSGFCIGTISNFCFNSDTKAR